MDPTSTTDDDSDVNISLPNDALRKRQFTMHVCCNACEGEKRDGYKNLVCKELPRGRRKEIEKMSLDL